MVILYSTHCPRCNVLKEKLENKDIEFTEVNDVDEMLKLNIMSAPMLKVNDDLLNFKRANDWINEQ
jgi:glutaredoxin-related protein